MRKFFDIILSLLSVCGVFYFVYQAIYNDDGIVAVVLRLVAALILSLLVIRELKNGTDSKKDDVWEWYSKDEPKGMFLYVVKYGVFSGIIAGYLTWLMFTADFDNNQDLFVSAINHMAPLCIGGVAGA